MLTNTDQYNSLWGDNSAYTRPKCAASHSYVPENISQIQKKQSSVVLLTEYCSSFLGCKNGPNVQLKVKYNRVLWKYIIELCSW